MVGSSASATDAAIAGLSSWAGSISAKAARWLDGAEFVEIEIDDRLQRLAGGAVVQRFGQRVEPGSTLRLNDKEFGDGVAPSLGSRAPPIGSL